MLTPIEATKLLNLYQIPFDIQQKILMYFLSYGTPTSNLIKIQTNCPDTSFNGSLVETFILEHEMTLWKIKVFLNKGIIFNSSSCIKYLRILYELEIAYMTNTRSLKNFDSISNLKNAIKTNSDYELFVMFYNLDKDKYSYLGTPTANIIHNAISNNIIYEFHNMINYDMDSDDEYY